MEEVGFGMSLQTRITKLKLSYFGHVLRGDGLEKSIMLGMGNGCRGRGRSRKGWLDEIREITGLNLQKLVTATGDRDQWRRLVNAWVPARFLKKEGKKRFDLFYTLPPTFEFAHPGFSVLGGQKRIVAHANY